ncbi:MAG: peptidoglycan-binding protein [Candidatus Paceibacterota bacterium]
MNRSHARIVISFIFFVSLISISSVFAVRSASAQTTACSDLSYDLYSGLADRGDDNSVLLLQRYLAGSGYLAATPNGYFGPATLAAVKSLQRANGISTTGRVGPQTRAAIKSLSCRTTAVTPSSQTSQTVLTPVVQNVTIPVASEMMVGNKYTITWHPRTGTIYNLTLDDQYGIGAGYVATNVSGGRYEWTVGEIYSARTRSNTILTPGRYSFRAQDVNKGALPTDERSVLFTLLPKPIVISSITPSSAPNDDKTAVVIYGSGFDASSRIRFDGYSDGYATAPLYISADGRVLVFTVPRGIYPSIRSVRVNNTYESNATSSPSNAIDFIVTPS